VNRTLQNNGIEEYMRKLAASAKPGERFRLLTSTSAHPGTLRLSQINYRIEVVVDGTATSFAQMTIRVAEKSPPITTWTGVTFASNTVAKARANLAAVPDIVRSAGSVTAR
jgi:hypothetical protein